jgi:asparagine synthase (glutamine-hydrolysing)
MCGIAGGVWTGGAQPLTSAIVERMTDAIRHRGPDDAGIYLSSNHRTVGRTSKSVPANRHQTSGNSQNRSSADGLGSPSYEVATSACHHSAHAALGFRRLSIIDLAGGHQPLANEDGTVWIVFNGEIYNYRELRPELESRGHTFATHTDTECIVHLYEEYGVDCVQHLRGMFAFAIWDERRGRLFVARDRLGQKPLFYRQEPDRLLFASELKAILQVPGLPRQLDPAALDMYLTYQYVPDPHCILKGYNKLPPAHRAVWEDGELTVERYWRPPYSDPFSDEMLEIASDVGEISRDAWQRMLRETLTEAVRLRMRSDVPLGAFLSGGIDSTIIAGLMQSLSDEPIHTFSIGFAIKEFDETSYAREAAAKLGTRHHEYIVEPSAIDLLPKIIWHYDEPFSDSSAIPTMYLAEVTRREVTVALSGDGGDELFSGYERYQAVKLAQRFDLLPESLRKVFAWKLWQRIPSSGEQRSLPRRIKRFIEALGQSPELRYLRWIGIFDRSWREELYTDEFKARIDWAATDRVLLDAYGECPDRDFITRTTCADVLTYLPFDILKKVDIATMACSLEARSPFLDHHVVELASRMPIELKLQGRRGKVILTETFADLLPASIQTRAKMGFGVPIGPWFRGELKELLIESLLSEQALSRGYFRRQTIERLIDEHLSGQWDHSYRLWNLLCLEQWCRTYLDPAEVPVDVTQS